MSDEIQPLATSSAPDANLEPHIEPAAPPPPPPPAPPVPAAGDVIFVMKERKEPITIELDVDKLTWGDNLEFSRLANADEDDEEAFELLTKFISKIAGQDVSLLPSPVVIQIIEQIGRLAAGDTEERKN